MEECLADGKVNGTHRHTSDLCTRQMWMKMDETNVWTFCNDVVQGKYNDFWTQSVENEHSNHVFARSTTTHTVQFHVHLDTRKHTHVHSLHSQLNRSICRQRKNFEFLWHSKWLKTERIEFLECSPWPWWRHFWVDAILSRHNIKLELEMRRTKSRTIHKWELVGK